MFKLFLQKATKVKCYNNNKYAILIFIETVYGGGPIKTETLEGHLSHYKGAERFFSIYLYV